jgi:molybdate transport system regulatory protein
MVVVGPGKVNLLQAIDALGSISAAGRALGLGFRWAWSILDEFNKAFGLPCIEPVTGGQGGGGARLTELGAEIGARYDAIEPACERASKTQVQALATRQRR